MTHELQWRHNGRDGVSNYQPHYCLLNLLFRRRSKKTSKLRATGLCAGNWPVTVNSPHKWPVTRKMFPYDDIIMVKLFLFLDVIKNSLNSLSSTIWQPTNHFLNQRWWSSFRQISHKTSNLNFDKKKKKKTSLVNVTIVRLVIWDPVTLIMTSL